MFLGPESKIIVRCPSPGWPQVARVALPGNLPSYLAFAAMGNYPRSLTHLKAKSSNEAYALFLDIQASL